MSKETILAVVAGLSIGVLAAWGVWNFSQKKRENIPAPVLLKNESPAPVKSAVLTLVLDKPENDSLQKTETATVSGKTVKDATIVISTNSADQVLTASPDGSFKTTVDLTEGQNEISVTAFNQTGDEKTETRTVNYTSEDF